MCSSDLSFLILEFVRKIAASVNFGKRNIFLIMLFFFLQAKYGPVGLIHVDAHADTADTMFGEKIAHGTPFRRAVEEGLLDLQRVVQIGLRGTNYTLGDLDWGVEQVSIRLDVGL